MTSLVRRYDEPVEVRWQTAAEGPPEVFLWRGKVHKVREVLDHWRARTAWWRELLDGEGSPVLEHEIWRVEASAGRLAERGVYDLIRLVSAAGEDQGWRLVRTGD